MPIPTQTEQTPVTQPSGLAAGSRLGIVPGAMACKSHLHADDTDLDAFAPEVDLPLDDGIKRAVLILRRAGIETFESLRRRTRACLPRTNYPLRWDLCGWI